MTKKRSEDKSGLTEILNRIWLLIAGFIGAITLIYNFYKLWQGDQETVTIIIGVIGLAVSITVLAWISFSKTNQVSTESKKKKSSRQDAKYPKVQTIARVSLLFIIVATIAGVALLYKHREDLENKVIVVIAVFDGPEDQYGVRNQLLEQLNISLTGFNDIKIIPIDEIITPSEGSERAKEIGQDYQADIVIWGWYRPIENPNLTLHIENLSSTQSLAMSNSITKNIQGDLADLKSFSLQQQIGTKMSSVISFLSGFLQFSSGNYENALERLDQALNDPEWVAEFSENQTSLFFMHGYTLITLNRQFDQAIIDFTQVLQSNPQSIESYINRGVAYDNLGKYEQAIADYNQALQLDAQSFTAYGNRGVTYSELGEYEKAIADYSQFININPNDPKAYYNRGLSYTKLGQDKQALTDFNLVIQLDPQYPEVYNDRGIAYVNLGQNEQAVTDFTKAIQIDPQLAKVYHNRGTAYIYLAKYELAITDFNKAIQIDPQFSEAYTNRGLAYNRLGKNEQAIDDYTQAIKIDPQNTQAYHNRGFLYQNLGKTKEAEADFQMYKELTGKTP